MDLQCTGCGPTRAKRDAAPPSSLYEYTCRRAGCMQQQAAGLRRARTGAAAAWAVLCDFVVANLQRFTMNSGVVVTATALVLLHADGLGVGGGEMSVGGCRCLRRQVLCVREWVGGWWVGPVRAGHSLGVM